MAFGFPVSHLATIWSNGNHMQDSLLCQLGAVICSWDSPWRVQMVCDHCCCGWCGPLTFCPGRWHPQVWSCGETCSQACWMAKWLTAMSASSLESVLNGFAISFPRSFPSWQYARTIWQCSSCSRCSSLIILQWSISVLMHVTRSWGSSPGPGHNIFKFSKMHMGVDVMCHSLLDLVKEGRSFHLGCFLFLFTASSIHCACISRDLVPRAAKTYLRWSLLSGRMQLRRSQFSRVWQNMEKE